MPVSRRLRFEILRRDAHTCRYCGAKAPDVALTVDHVIPVALGGGDDPTNLITACQPCNAGKSSMPADAPIVEDVDAAALLWAKAIERAALKRQAELADTRVLVAEFDDMWTAWTYSDGGTVERDDDWATSVERFFAHGLTVDDLRDLVRQAMTHPGVRNEWRMFCRKAWDEIGHRQELARRMIEDGEV